MEENLSLIMRNATDWRNAGYHSVGFACERSDGLWALACFWVEGNIIRFRFSVWNQLLQLKESGCHSSEYQGSDPTFWILNPYFKWRVHFVHISETRFIAVGRT